MKNTFLSVLVCCLSLILSAQEVNDDPFRVKAANIQFGLYSGTTPLSNLSDFKKLVPNSTLQASDLVGFRSQHSASETSGPALSLNVVLQKPNTTSSERLNMEFRFGISYQQIDLLYLGYNKEEEFRIDTLTSSRNGQQVFVDSIHSQNYDLTYSQRNAMLDADVLISTNPNKRFKFYGGLGLSLGLSIAPQTSIRYNSFSRLEQDKIGYDDFDNRFRSEGSSENLRNKEGFFGRIYVPLGIDFRVSKSNQSLVNYHLFLESRPSLSFHTVAELSTISTTSNVSSIGIRYDF